MRVGFVALCLLVTTHSVQTPVTAVLTSSSPEYGRNSPPSMHPQPVFPPQPPARTVTLKSGVTLTGSINYTLTGTPTAHIALQCNGYQFVTPDQTWSGGLRLQYVDASNCGSATADAFGGTTGTSAYVSGGTVTFDHVTWHRSGGIDLYTVNGACVRVTNSVWAADNVWPSGMNDQAAPGIFHERGTSTCTKVFQGNRLEKSWAGFGSPNWIVGSRTCTAADAPLSNYFIGERAGFGLGAGSEAACNYSHSIEVVTPQRPYWADVENLRGPGAGAVVHDNVFNTGQWMTTGIDGDLHDNVYVNGGGHDYWRIGDGGTAHGNILFGATGFSNGQRYGSGISYTVVPGEYAAIDLLQSGNHFSVTHNTIDLTGQVEHGCVRVIAGATLDSYQNNLCVGVPLGRGGGGSAVAALAPDYTEGLVSPPPVRLRAADYNDTVFAAATTPLVYDLTTAGGLPCGAGGPGTHDVGGCNGAGLDPKFRGPLPIAGPYDLAGRRSSAFPFNDADLLNGTYTIADVLAWARWVYAPGAGSPLLGAASDGGDIGAVQATSLPATAPVIVTTNKRPVVSAGPPFTTGPTQFGGDVDHAELVGWGADDGLPNGVLTFQWTQVSGPATATIDFPMRSAATATLPACGDYVFRLAVSDGVLTSADQVIITKACATPSRRRARAIRGSGSMANALACAARASPQSCAVVVAIRGR